MLRLAYACCALAAAAACDTSGARPSALVDTADAADEPPEPEAPEPAHGKLDVVLATQEGAPKDTFRSKDEVFFTTTAVKPGGVKDYFFRVIDSSGMDVSRSDLQCRRIRIGQTGRVEQIFTGIVGQSACPHSTSVDRVHGGGVSVGVAPFGDANAILDGVATYQIELVSVERFAGFEQPELVAGFVLDMR